MDRESCRRRLLELMADSQRAEVIQEQNGVDSSKSRKHRRASSDSGAKASAKIEEKLDSSKPSKKRPKIRRSQSKFAYPFGELLADRKVRVRKSSAFGRLKDWGMPSPSPSPSPSV